MPDAMTNDLRRRMDSALEALQREFAGLRTGRASAHLLDKVVVKAYGSDMPLNQVGNVNVPEPRLISVQVWDRGLVVAVEKAIREAGLGLNPVTDGQLVRIPIPELSQERRHIRSARNAYTGRPRCRVDAVSDKKATIRAAATAAGPCVRSKLRPINAPAESCVRTSMATNGKCGSSGRTR